MALPLKTSISTACIAFLWVLLIPFARAQSLAELQKELDLDYLPDAFDYPESDAVIVSESHDIDVDFDTNFKLSTFEDVRVVKKIFKNLDEHASVELLIPSWVKLDKIEARTILPNGKSIPLGKKDFYTITSNSGNTVFYSDEKTIKFTFKGVEKDAIVEYSYRVHNNFPFEEDIWWIQGEIPKLRNRYTLNIPKVLFEHDWNWFYKAYNYDVGPPKTIIPIAGKGPTLREKNVFQWNLKDIPAFHRERMMPPVRNYIGYVKFAPNDWKSYADISRTYEKYYFQPQCVITDLIRQKALELTARCSNDSERIQKLYDYVRGFRYIAVNLDVGGIKPSLPQTVMDRQYGDCKDKSILLISMLQSLNIKAYPVLALTANSGLVDPNFPNWSFNHMIVKSGVISNKGIWMDPTAETYELGKLPWTDQGAEVLVIYPNGDGILETTFSTSYDQNVTDVNIELENISTGDVKFALSISYSGEDAYDHEYTFKDMTYNDLRKYCQSLIADEYLSASLDTVILTKPAATGMPLKLQFSFTASKAIQQQADLYFLSADPFKLIDKWSWLILENRRYPIDFHYAHMVRKRITAKLKNNLAIRNLPGNIDLNIGSMAYSKKYTSSGLDGWQCDEVFALRDYLIWPNDYKTAKDFFQKMKASLEEKTILMSKR